MENRGTRPPAGKGKSRPRPSRNPGKDRLVLGGTSVGLGVLAVRAVLQSRDGSLLGFLLILIPLAVGVGWALLGFAVLWTVFREG